MRRLASERRTRTRCTLTSPRSCRWLERLLPCLSPPRRYSSSPACPWCRTRRRRSSPRSSPRKRRRPRRRAAPRAAGARARAARATRRPSARSSSSSWAASCAPSTRPASTVPLWTGARTGLEPGSSQEPRPFGASRVPAPRRRRRALYQAEHAEPARQVRDGAHGAPCARPALQPQPSSCVDLAGSGCSSAPRAATRTRPRPVATQSCAAPECSRRSASHAWPIRTACRTRPS